MASDKPPAILHQPPQWLTGQLLIAMPGMTDDRFARAVIYICSHGPNGAMGLVINRSYGDAKFSQLLDQLDIAPSNRTPELLVHAGGPVETGRGFVLHSTDYKQDSTIPTGGNIGLSATIEILQTIADGDGPEKALMALGYTGWGAGQLDAEIKANGWLTAPADEGILFDSDLASKWERSVALLGISQGMLSGDAGHA